MSHSKDASYVIRLGFVATNHLLTVVADSPNYQCARAQLFYSWAIGDVMDVVIQWVKLVCLEIRNEAGLQVNSEDRIRRK